ncbi:MAG: hypothetical protein K2X47_16970 [Bdellovibrionales bacterium]|nr:hypothetical protein [Bdellovibrionales bacterium]
MYKKWTEELRNIQEFVSESAVYRIQNELPCAALLLADITDLICQNVKLSGRQIFEGTTLKLRSDLHISRKIFHCLGVLLIVAIYQALDYQTACIAITTAWFLLVPLDYLRLRSYRLKKTAVTLLSRIMRTEELSKMSSMTWLLSGSWISIVLFPRDVATLSLLLLAFGDPVASIFGIIYGRDRLLRKKTLQGTLAGFAICTAVGATYYFSTGLMIERIVLVSILTGVIGAVSEIVPVANLDDNLTSPTISSLLLMGLFGLFSGLNV